MSTFNKRASNRMEDKSMVFIANRTYGPCVRFIEYNLKLKRKRRLE